MTQEFLFVEKYRPQTIEETILPDNLKKYMLDKSYGLEYIFVSEFKLIKFLKKFEWEYTPYLPLIDIYHIRNILTINQDL